MLLAMACRSCKLNTGKPLLCGNDQRVKDVIQDELREGSLVLIVDDSQLDRTLMQHLCKSIGYETLLAADGREALDIVRTEPNLALMLTDMMMPDIDGVELLKQVRYSHPRLPVMLISGHSREEINSALRGIEVSLVVQKPIQPEAE